MIPYLNQVFIVKSDKVYTLNENICWLFGPDFYIFLPSFPPHFILTPLFLSDFMDSRSILWLISCSFRPPAISRAQSKLSVDLLYPGAQDPSLKTSFTPFRAAHTLIFGEVPYGLFVTFGLIFSLISGAWLK